MKIITKLFALALLFSAGISHAEAARNVREYNLQNSLGLKGYDPVAVFPEGGGAAVMGETAFRVDQEGVTYYFASAKNMKLFQADPGKYEPTYGGWCAYAMASGAKVDIQPNLFTIHGRRAHYFVSARAKRSFDADVAGHESRADTFWKQISGEDARN